MRTIHPMLIECVRDAKPADAAMLAQFAGIIADDLRIGCPEREGPVPAACERPIMAWARCALDGSAPRR